MNINILNPKIWVLKMSSKAHNGDFLGNGLKDFD
jgi:hypothetical protein